MTDINADNYWERMQELEKKETAEDTASINKSIEKTQDATKDN